LPQRRKLLLVDDSQLPRNYIKNTLTQQFGPIYDFIEANNGADGLALALSEKPEALFLDWNMSKMDGLQVLKAIRAKEDEDGLADEARLKIIMATSEGSKSNVMDAVGSGVTDYLVKPLSTQALIRCAKDNGLC
jgi:two-component system, chemotaxis family, chemotaxis protein CheY